MKWLTKIKGFVNGIAHQRQCMKLPDGKTCRDCRYANWCSIVHGVKPEDTSCKYIPIRFEPKEVE